MSRNQEENSRNIPDFDPSKAMDSRKEVEKSPDEKTDQDFPGYPHYPAKEDMMDQRTDATRLDLDVENLSAENTSGVSQRFGNAENDPNDQAAAPGSERRGTGSLDDLPHTPPPRERVPQNVSNEDLPGLDIPGSELDDMNESIGEEDEENNYYSLGGDRHEHQEEDPQSGPDRGGY